MKHKIRIAVLIAVGIAILIFAIKKLSGPAIPTSFQTLAGRFEQASSVQIDLLWPQPGSPRQNLVALRWNRTGKAAADVLEGPQGRLTLINGMVKLATADIQPPIPALNEPAQELYQEMLTGFANSDWRTMDPPAHGVIPPRMDREWVGITLPFDWARNHELQLGISKASGKLEIIAVEAQNKPEVAVTFRQFRGGPMTFQISDSAQLWLVVEDIRWNHSIPADDFDPTKHP